MDDFDRLADRLHELGQRAPVPVADPCLDIRRGRVALRRRNARSTAGVTTALVAAGAVATTIPGLQLPGGGGSGTVAGGFSVATSPATPSPPTAKELCAIEGRTVLPGVNQRDPEVAAVLSAYREAAASILDPSDEHLDPAASKRSENVQAGSYCDPKTGEHLTSISTKIGWTDGGDLGVIQIEVASPDHYDELQTVLNHTGWTVYEGELPTGVSAAEIAKYNKDDGGHAVVVERADGLTVAISAASTWGNNVALGSAPATNLPGIDKLVQLAASPELTLPDGS